jgi:TolA-binding protein
MANQTSHFRKTIPAYLAALVMTGLIGVCILAFGVSALLNRNTVPVQAAAPQGAVAAPTSDLVVAGQVTDQSLRDQIAQYQARETQLQSQLQQAADQINQLSQQNQQYQNLVNYLQDAGVIQITPDGRVYVNRDIRGGNGDSEGE